jgi:DNA-binding transcriptional LysR family regulator
MNLHHLRAFVTIADAGGVGPAVARLHRSQPALSRQIRALEDELGLRLFDRIGRRLRITADGEDLLRRSRRLLADSGALEERAHALRAGHTGVLRIGATPQVLESVLAMFLASYRRRWPGVEVHLFEEGGARLPTLLERSEVLLTIMAISGDHLARRPLFPIHTLVVMPRGHALGRRPRVEVAELAEEPLLVLRRTFASREWLEAACLVAHLRPRVALESGSPHTLVALARAGHGIAVIPSPVRYDPRGVHAAALMQRGVPVGRWAAVSWDPQRFLPPYAEHFVQDIVAFCRRHHPGRLSLGRLPPMPQPPSR